MNECKDTCLPTPCELSGLEEKEEDVLPPGKCGLQPKAWWEGAVQELRLTARMRVQQGFRNDKLIYGWRPQKCKECGERQHPRLLWTMGMRPQSEAHLFLKIIERRNKGKTDFPHRKQRKINYNLGAEGWRGWAWGSRGWGWARAEALH